MWSRRLSPAAGARRLQTSERRAHRSQRSGTAIRPSAWVPDVVRRRNTGRIDHADTPAVPEPRTAWGQGPPPIGCRARRPVAHERQPRARGAPKKRGFGKSCGFASSAVPARSGGAPRDWFPTRRTRGTRRHGGTLVEQVSWVGPHPSGSARTPSRPLAPRRAWMKLRAAGCPRGAATSSLLSTPLSGLLRALRVLRARTGSAPGVRCGSVHPHEFLKPQKAPPPRRWDPRGR